MSEKQLIDERGTSVMRGRAKKAWNGGVRPDSTELMRLLGELYETEVEKLAWLMTAQPLLGGAVPVHLVATPEGYEKCVCMLQAVADGVYS